LYSSEIVIRMKKSRKMRWAGRTLTELCSQNLKHFSSESFEYCLNNMKIYITVVNLWISTLEWTASRQNQMTGFCEHGDERLCYVQKEYLDNQLSTLALPWLRMLLSGFLLQSPRLTSGSVHVRFIVNNVTLGQVFLQTLRFFPVTVIPPWLWGWTMGPLLATVQRHRLTA
jgi:hypothetical protein